MTTPEHPSDPPPVPAPVPATRESLAALGRERFVALTTYRRDGRGVSTPVWVAAHGDDLVVTTPAGSGKTKRLAHDPRVLLRPCTRFGKVDPDAAPVAARAVVLGPEAEHRGEADALVRKYRLEHRVVVAVEGLVRRRRGGSAERWILRLSAA